MRILIIVLSLLLVAVAAVGYHYCFVRTVMLSDVVGKNDSTLMDVLITSVDFDTGLTRWDLHLLKNKAGYWQRRIDEVESIDNYSQRMRANEELLNEMMNDPQLKKIAIRILPLGKELLLRILQSL